MLDGQDADHAVGAVELLLLWPRLGRVHLYAVHVPGELDLRVLLAHINHHARDLGCPGDHEGVLGFWREDEDRGPGHFTAWWGRQSAGQLVAWGPPGHLSPLGPNLGSGYLLGEEGEARVSYLGIWDMVVWSLFLRREHTESLGVGRAQGWAQVRVRSWYIPEQLVLLGAQGRGRGPACAHPGLSEVPS